MDALPDKSTVFGCLYWTKVHALGANKVLHLLLGDVLILDVI